MQQVREAKSLGASAVMVLGTAGDLTFKSLPDVPFQLAAPTCQRHYASIGLSGFE